MEAKSYPTPKGLERIGESAWNIDASWKDKAVVIGRVEQTNCPTIQWWWLAVIRWTWPPIRVVATYANDDIAED